MHSILAQCTQEIGDRAISAERRIRALEAAEEKAELRRKAESPVTKDSLPVPATPTTPSVERMIANLTSHIESTTPCPLLQSFCAVVLRKVADPRSGKGTLARKRRGNLQFSIGFCPYPQEVAPPDPGRSAPVDLGRSPARQCCRRVLVLQTYPMYPVHQGE